jgi:hypothetical protein
LGPSTWLASWLGCIRVNIGPGERGRETWLLPPPNTCSGMAAAGVETIAVALRAIARKVDVRNMTISFAS